MYNYVLFSVFIIAALFTITSIVAWEGQIGIVTILAFITGLAGGALYMIPSSVATNRKHPNERAIFLLNALAGWSIVGWIGSLVWASISLNTLTTRRNTSAIYSSISTRKCPYCAELVSIEAKVCKHCNKNISPAFAVPEKYSLERLPSHQKEIILNRTAQENLASAISLINLKVRHESIATLQHIIESVPVDSQVYSEAYELLYVIFKGQHSA